MGSNSFEFWFITQQHKKESIVWGRGESFAYDTEICISKPFIELQSLIMSFIKLHYISGYYSDNQDNKNYLNERKTCNRIENYQLRMLKICNEQRYYTFGQI